MALRWLLEESLSSLWPTWLPGVPWPRFTGFATQASTSTLDDAKPQEENWSFYSPKLFYPVFRIGEISKARYPVLGKPEHGAHSTVWMGRDVREDRYVAIKVCESDSVVAQRELAAYHRIKAVSNEQPGKALLRELLDHLKIPGRGPIPHLCLVHEPLSFRVEEMRCLLSPGRKRPHARRLNDASFRLLEESEATDPSSCKVYGDRTVYESGSLSLSATEGRPVLCDLGEARHGQQCYDERIQPLYYRAPEVILSIPWTYSADIWSLGLVAWDVVQGSPLFRSEPTSEESSPIHHLAEMIGLIGLPPKEFLDCGEGVGSCFDESGAWTADADAGIQNRSLEDCEGRLEGEEKARLVVFVKKMLCWMPEERQAAEGLLRDAWLNTQLVFSPA